MADRHPDHDVAAGGGVERALGVDGLEAIVGAVEADIGAGLDAPSAVDRGPHVAGRVLVGPGALGQLDLEAAFVSHRARAGEIAHTELAGTRRIREELALGALGLPAVT